MASLRFLLCCVLVNCACATIVSHDGRTITIDGHCRVLLSGSIHYPRSTPEMWPDLIKKGKEGGVDAIETYVFLNAHEPTRRQYDFFGKLDLIRFLKTIQDEGLGFPVWLHNMPRMVFRTTNKAFMDEMQNFTTMIVDMVKKEKLFASQGGPIILAQIENEYGNIMGPFGEAAPPSGPPPSTPRPKSTDPSGYVPPRQSPQSAGKFQIIHLATIAAPGQPIDADEAKLALDSVSAAIQQLATAMQTLTSVVGQIASMLYPRGEEEGDDPQQQDDQENLIMGEKILVLERHPKLKGGDCRCKDQMDVLIQTQVQQRMEKSLQQRSDKMQNFTTMIVDMVKKEKLFASQGGPIILAQIENEYGNIMGPYGEAGKSYIKLCANMAQALNVGVPWIMCQQNDAPQPMLNTCNGFYCDKFSPNNLNTPKMWTENWTGWFKQWGGKNPHRTTEDVAFSVARFFQRGGTFNNYYMYHGGTNFDRSAGGPYITTSYDYDAPLDEYGNLNQPKYGHLKQLHDVLHSMEKTLTYGNISTIDFGNSASATIYTTQEGSSCFFGNGNENSDATISFRGESYVVPAWSVTILPDCKTEAYNTAKITTQTSMMVKKPNEAEDDPSTLKWSWRPENMDNFVLTGKGESTNTQLFDQKVVSNDQSDYLWYMTTVKFRK
ncbi:hypothetical protein F2Q68_00016520 [Brassica cretica]|uniref:Beta-galactosidase n=1 Tax=Brassica cretica TaxID=69181 RepID=A0A8S9HGW8_BRACR|nr:hypothetical protein F2Q68_00016520 [Brassica cretica]